MGGCYLLGKCFPQQGEGKYLPGRLGKLLNYFFPQEEGEHLPVCFLPRGKGEHLPGKPERLLSCFLPQREGEHLAGK